MKLSGEFIQELYELGVIVIDPYLPELVSVNSVDVRLGDTLFRLRDNDRVRDPYSRDDIDAEWEKQPLVPITCTNIVDSVPVYDTKGFLLTPGRFYIATTLERIGSKYIDWRYECQGENRQHFRYLAERFGDFQVIPNMAAKSTTGRHGLTVARCAGSGDVGYHSQWALEMTVERGGQLPLAVGTVIGQVLFDMCTHTSRKYDGVARYQHDGNLTSFLPKPFQIIP